MSVLIRSILHGNTWHTSLSVSSWHDGCAQHDGCAGARACAAFSDSDAPSDDHPRRGRPDIRDGAPLPALPA
jgi:hypothetical protein